MIRSSRATPAVVVGLLVSAWTAPARAEPPAATSDAPKPPAVSSNPPKKAGKARRAHVAWASEWPRFRWWEYAGTAVAWGLDWYVRYHLPPPDHAVWVGNNPFDDTIRGWLRLGTPGARATAVTVSDRVSLAGTIYPFVVDLPVALLVHRQPGVMWQLLMMDLEAFAVAGLINNSLYHVAGRGRPNTQSCIADPSYDPLCGGIGDNASLPSGHVLTIATATGLTCVHHRYLPLYGADIADESACILMSLATVATGFARIMADRHFATDVLMGGAIGFGSGYGLPWLLHYRVRRTPEGAPEVHGAMAVLPLAGPGMLGLSVVGVETP